MTSEQMNTSTVAELITEYAYLSGKTDDEIARDLGYENLNSIKMLMNGSIRVPMNKVRPLAESLGIDPMHLLKKVMGEYMPETLVALQDLLEGLSLSQSERDLVDAYRRVAQGRDVTPIVCEKTVLAVVMLD